MLHSDVLEMQLSLPHSNTGNGIYTQEFHFGLISTWHSPSPPLDHPHGFRQTLDGPGHVQAQVGGALKHFRIFNPQRRITVRY